MRLTILHFNDLHGRLDRLVRLSTLIQRERDQARRDGRQVLLLDAGDSSDRARWESDITKGRANFALLEALGVQASVIGNGEALQWGRAALARLPVSVSFPVLAANLVDLADPSRPAVAGLKRSVRLDCAGLPMGMVGVTARYPGGYDRFGYTAADARAALRREIAALKAGGARLIVLLSHLGVALSDTEKQTWPDPTAFTDDEAAEAFPELGAIVGGHSHTTLEQPLARAGTPIVQAGDYGRYLGRLDLEVEAATGRMLAFDGRLIPCGDDVPPDPTLAGTLELVREEANRLLDAPVATALNDVPHYIDRASPFAGRVADALRDICRADLAIFYNGFAQGGLKAGPIRRRDLYQALPGSAHVTAAEVSGAQIRRMLERMLASKYRTESFNPQRNAPPLGLPAASANVQLAFDLDRNALLECRIDGRELDDAGRYRLASTYYTLNDITGDDEYDFIGLQPGQVIEMVQVEEVLWEVVEGWLQQRGKI
jgi:5'-nucleotidase